MRLLLFLVLGIGAVCPAWGASATLRVRPSVVVGSPGSTVTVPLALSSPDRISVVRFTLEYDSAAVTFAGVEIGADAPNFSIAAINENPYFAPKSPGTDRNLLVIVWSSSSTWITGNDKELVRVRFTLASQACKTSPVNFDGDCNHTDASTFEGNHICGANFTLRNGAAGNGCTTDAQLPEPPLVRLHQNVPNPFNPNTSIGVEADVTAAASLRVFDSAGALVRTLFEGTLGEGRHDFVWDGRDAAGGRLPSGIYFYRLQSRGIDTSRSMVLLK